MNKNTKKILQGIIIVMAALICPLEANADDDVNGYVANTIPQGVSISGVDFSGNTMETARENLNNIVSKYDDIVFTLKANENSIEATGKELKLKPVNYDVLDKAMGYGTVGNLVERYKNSCDIYAGKKKEFDLSLTSDWNTTKEYLEDNIEKLNSEPTEHTLKREGGKFVVVEGESGVVVDVEKSATEIGKYITSYWTGEEDGTITLALVTKEPKGSVEDLVAVNDLLGSCSTNYGTSGPARATNIKIGTSRINGTVLYPGEVYSVSNGLGKRNAENGYQPAPSYENGTTVDSYGGGVCQISSTLYNAVIRSELEVVERSAHSMVVSYVKPSMDAAIAEGLLDFKFKNNQDYPVFIEGYTTGAELGFNIYGKETRPSNRTVKFESETTSVTEAETVYKADASLPLGKIEQVQGPHTGYTARLWKVVTVNGKEESRKVFNESRYYVSNAIYSVGTNTDKPELAEALNQAIATGDKDIIKNTASSLASGTPVEPILPNNLGPNDNTPVEIPAPAPAPAPEPVPTPAPLDTNNQPSDIEGF